jgi:hypothetical protein
MSNCLTNFMAVGWFIDLTQLTSFRGIHSRFYTVWWYTYPSEKYDVGSWDDGKIKNVPNHQPDYILYTLCINGI